MKFWFAIILISSLFNCTVQKPAPDKQIHNPDDYTIKTEAARNVMPGSTNNSPYLVFVIRLKQGTLEHNFKISKLVVDDGEHTYECSNFDRKAFRGKGLVEYVNVARDLGNISLSSSFTMILELVDEDGNKLNFRVNEIKIINAE